MRFAHDQFPQASDGQTVTANSMRLCRKRQKTTLCFTDRLNKHRPTAFTFVELCFGLIITALVMAGLAAFSLAMSTAWQNAGSSEATLLAANQDIRLLDAKLRPCGLTGGWQAGSLDGTAQPPAAVLLWTADNNNSSTINYSEIMLIEHDPQAQQIKLYQAPMPLTVPDAVFSYATLFSQSSFINTFKDGLTPTVLCSNVVGARFYVGPATSASATPFVEFALTIQSGNQTRVVYGDATLRAALAVPTN
jgi:type II secretory pathway pseudopilin PulG